MTRNFAIWAAPVALVLGLAGVTGASAATVRNRPAVLTAQAAASSTDDYFDPGPYQRRLDPLVGTWKAVKYNYILGSDGTPVISHDITVKVRWITKTGGRFLQEQTEGTLAGKDYYRLGVLGFSNVDRRYEWTTFDSVTPMAMTYRGAPVTGLPSVLSIPGTFTDPGLLGPAGRTIAMRTVITIRPKDHSSFDLYFTPPGQAERLVDRVVYTHRIR